MADLVPLPFTLPETSSSAVSAQPESKIGPSSPVEIVASPADTSMQCPDDVLWRCPDEVSTGLDRHYHDVLRKACDVVAFTNTADMFGSQANHQVPRYFSTDDSDTEVAGTDVFPSSLVA